LKEQYYKKTNIVGCNVDDIVEDLKQLKDKMTWLEGNLYSKGMLIFVEDKQAIYEIKEREV